MDLGAFWARKAAQHYPDHGETDEGCDSSGMALVVAHEATIPADPREGPFHNPSLWQNLEAVKVSTLDDLQMPRSRACDGRCHFWPLITAVCVDARDKGESASCPAQKFEGAVAILNAGGMDDDVQ